jgi:hypothetical protein
MEYDFSQSNLLVRSNGDKESTESADYFFYHMNKRNTNVNSFHVQRSDDTKERFFGGVIYFEIVPDLTCDYEIVNSAKQLSLFAKDKQILKWLSYQLIDKLGQFKQLWVQDLPPGYIDFKSRKANFTLSYREPHLLSNMDDDYGTILNTNSIDRDWGVWGHHMEVFFEGDIPEQSMALVNGKKVSDQFCFGANETFESIRQFVIDQYGYGEKASKWFMIAPNDNDLVCTCSICKKHGNSNSSATGALTFLVNRLSKEFPNHHFFTLAYRTSKNVSPVILEKNAGVFISTVDLPKKPKLDVKTKPVADFLYNVKSWRSKTSQIYLWDYIANFDDYLTPLPLLERVHKQLLFFKHYGVNGLFLNGSGYDYSTFEGLYTYVLSALMVDSSLDAADLVRKYHQRFFPTTAALLTSYVLSMERSALSGNMETGIYTSFRSASESYFDGNKFEAFYNELTGLYKGLSGEEKKRVDKMLVGLSYTKAQLSYHSGNLNETLLDRLSAYKNYTDMKKYKEEGGALKTYLDEWKLLKQELPLKNKVENMLVHELRSGKIISEGNLLHDGVRGFLSDFNQGWMIAGEDIQVNTQIVDSTTQFRMRFLLNKKHGMKIPAKVEVFNDSNCIAVYNKGDFFLSDTSATLEKRLQIHKSAKIGLKIYISKDEKKSIIACDEIQLF